MKWISVKDQLPQPEDKLLPHEISATVAKNIKRLRAERNLTIAKLAEEVGCMEVTMSRYEKDQHIPNVVMLYNLAQCFGVSVDEFYRR